MIKPSGCHWAVLPVDIVFFCLFQEWEEKQLRLKEEEIEITYSYWDGSGHRRTMQMKKGQTIYQFLQKCLEDLRKDFTELRTVTADQVGVSS